MIYSLIHLSFGGIVCVIIIFFLCSLLDKCRKTTESSQMSTDKSTSSDDKENLSRMTKVAEQYSDHTAEVFNFSVHGKSKVLTCRLLQPGDKIELRLKDNFLKIFAFGKFISEIYVGSDSNLHMVFEKNIQFHSYLGSRYNYFMIYENFDYCKVIIFYKVEGIPPSKVDVKFCEVS